jgi:hypothetical protein
MPSRCLSAPDHEIGAQMPVTPRGRAAKGSQTFLLFLIKPSHYDDDGYVIQWARNDIPSNTLASLYGIALDCAARGVLGDGVDLRIVAIDETNCRVKTAKIIRAFRRAGGKGLVALVGVQSNQYPRALDIARPLRAAGIAVCVGGFHTAGSLAMLPEPPPEIREAWDLGITIFAGEAEGRLDEVLRDAQRGDLRPLYQYASDLPDLQGAPAPFLPQSMIKRNLSSRTTFDAGRGCPFQCSFCTIINVQGRKSRYRSADDVERIVRNNAAQGVRHFFITDDNFARNRNWEAIFDRLIQLREDEGLGLNLIIQVDTLCHLIPNFVRKAARAGVTRAFIGLENINPDNLIGAKKKQNRITEYRTMLQAWKSIGVITCCGYIIGFPNDTRERVLRDIEVIKRELPTDLLEFFYLTPLPGSEDHQILHRDGVWMDPDMNIYDAEHVTTGHPLMSAEEWRRAYREAWAAFYTPEHGDPDAPGACLRHPRAQDHDALPVVLRQHRNRRRPSLAGRPVPAQVPARSAAGIAPGHPVRVLSPLRLGNPVQDHASDCSLVDLRPHAPAGRSRSRGRRLPRSRTHAGDRDRDRRPRDLPRHRIGKAGGRQGQAAKSTAEGAAPAPSRLIGDYGRGGLPRRPHPPDLLEDQAARDPA